jgi:hypothetical protein
MAEDAGSIVAEIRINVARLAEDVKKAQAKMNAIIESMKKTGETAGKRFSKGLKDGLKDGFEEALKSAENLGKSITQSLGPLGLVLSAVSAAVNFLKEKIGAAVTANNQASQAFDDLGKLINKTIMPIFNSLASVIGKATEALVDFFSGTSAEQRKSAAALEDQKNALESYSALLEHELDLINEKAKVQGKVSSQDKDSLNSLISAREKYLDNLLKEKVMYGDLTGTVDRRIQREISGIASLKSQLKTIEDREKAAEKTLSTEAKIGKALDEQAAAEKAYKAAIQAANDAHKAGILTVEERQEALNSAEETYYNTLEKIVTAYDITGGKILKERDAMAQLVALDAQSARYAEAKKKAEEAAAEALKKLTDAREKLMNTMQSEGDALMQNYINAAQENKEYQRALDLQIRLIDMQRKRGRAELEAQLEAADAGKEIQDSTLAAYDKLTEAMKEAYRTDEIKRQKEEAEELARTMRSIQSYIDEQKDSAAALAIEQLKQNKNYEEAASLEIRLLKAQRERALEEKKHGDEWKSASQDRRKEIEREYQTATDAMVDSIARAEAARKEQVQKEIIGVINSLDDELARQAVAAANRNKQYEEAIQLERELIDKQRERGLAEMKLSDEWLEASVAERDEIEKKYKTITEGMKAAVESQSKEKSYNKELEDAEKAYNDAIDENRIRRELGIITIEEEKAANEAAQLSYYEAIQGIITEYRVLDEAVLKLRDSTGAVAANTIAQKKAIEDGKAALKLFTDTSVQYSDTLAEQEIARLREIGNIKEAIKLENDLMRAQRERARQALEDHEDWKKLSESQQKELLAGFDAATEGMVKSYNEAEKISNDIKNAEKTYLETLEKIAQNKAAGILTIREEQEAQEAAQRAYYDALQDIQFQYEDIEEGMLDLIGDQAALVVLAQEAAKARKEEDEQIEKAKQATEKMEELLISQGDVLDEQAIAYEKANQKTEEAIQLERELIKKQRERGKAALEEQLNIADVSEDNKQKILDDYEAITEGMIAAVGRGGDGLKNLADEWSKVVEQVMNQISSIGQSLIGLQRTMDQKLIDEIDKALKEEIKKEEDAIKEQKKIRSEAHEDRMKAIKDAHDAELEAQGLKEASTVEGLEAQIEAAKEAGDEILQYKLESRLKEKQMNDEYDALEKKAQQEHLAEEERLEEENKNKMKAMEEEAAHEKANIKYQSDLAEWGMNLTNAAVDSAMAVIKAWAQGGGLFGPGLAALTTAMTAVQLGVLAASKPTPPKLAFADGGIVPGRKSDGDTQSVNATAGELILNEAQQENVWEKMKKEDKILYLTIMLDGKPIAQSSATYFNNRQVVLEARAIRQ